MATNQSTQTPGTDERRSSNRSTPILLVVIFLAVIVLLGRSWFSAGGTKTETISQELGTAKQAEIFLTSGVNVLRVSEGSSDMLIAGRVEISNRERLERNFEMNGDIGVFRLESKSTISFPWFSRNTRHDWDLQLNPTIPLALTFQTGVGEVFLDLSKLSVTDLELTTGVGASTVELPATGQLTASIMAGVGETTIRIPQGLAARIEAKAGVGGVNVSGDFQKDGDTYISSDYNTATNRIDLSVTGGVGQVTVETTP